MDSTIDINPPVNRLGEQVYFLRVFILLMLVHFFLNFLGSPLLVYSSAAIGVTAFLAVLFLRWDQAFYITIIYTLINGQIKVLMGYNPFFRLLLDGLIVILILRSFARNKRIFDLSKIPDVLVWLLAAHCFWFVVCLFNPLGAGFIPSFAAGKFYILPILFFFTLLNEDMDVTSRLFKDFFKIFMFFVILEAALVIYQSLHGPEFMYDISRNYLSLFEKFKRFSSESLFRPWGTTGTPGGYSSFFFLSAGFIFLWTVQPGGDEAQRLSPVKKIFLFLFTGLSLFGGLISQVRSNFLKEVMIISFGLFFSLLGTRFVTKRIIGIGAGIALFLSLAVVGLNRTTTFSDYMSMEKIFDRYEAIGTIERATSQRLGFQTGLSAIGRRLEYPLGLGLGMATTYLKAYTDKRRENVDIDQGLYWTFDNFFAHVVTETGYGGLITCAIVVIMPFVLASLMLTALRRKDYVIYRTVCYCFVSVLAITVGQWGAIGVLFPPEFYFYWLYIALAFGSFYRAYPKKT